MGRIPEKVVFIHFAKAAGRYVNYYMTQQVFATGNRPLAEQGCKIYNSWYRGIDLRRDWNPEELIQLANNRHALQFPSPQQVRVHHARWGHDYLARQYVHNHNHGWNRRCLAEFRRNGWFSFMFLRDPAELLCSLWTWANKTVREGADPATVLNPVELISMPLDQFIATVLSDGQFEYLYGLPDYVDLIDHVAGFSEDNFRAFLRNCFDHEYRPENVDPSYRFSSGNPGYAAYRSQGRITDRTHRMLEQNDAVKTVRERLEPAF